MQLCQICRRKNNSSLPRERDRITILWNFAEHGLSLIIAETYVEFLGFDCQGSKSVYTEWIRKQRILFVQSITLLQVIAYHGREEADKIRFTLSLSGVAAFKLFLVIPVSIKCQSKITPFCIDTGVTILEATAYALRYGKLTAIKIASCCGQMWTVNVNFL